MGMPATGKAIRVGYIDMLRVDGGKMTDHWAQLDAVGMMQQLGALSAATAGA
jgi:predicted ester cyclase